MHLCTFETARKTAAGVVRGTFVYDLAQSFFRTFKRPFKFPDLLAFLQAGGMDRVGEIDFGSLKDDRTCAHPLKTILLRAPILRPPKIICVGLNYRDHAEEQKVKPPEHPLLFAKAPNATIGPDEKIVIPRDISEKIDFEVELGVVIGTEGFRIAKEDASKHILGYTVFNDVTARDIQKGDGQWFRGKSFSTFAPTGPGIVTADGLDASSLSLTMRVNGTIMQTGNTENMIFDIPTIIEFASACFPLEVGDVIATGTPRGVGVFRDPPVWLKEGDRLKATIKGIGSLKNTVTVR